MTAEQTGMRRKDRRDKRRRPKVTASFLTGIKIHYCTDPECLLNGEREW